MSPIALQRHSMLLDDMIAYEKDFVKDMETSWSLYFEPLCRPDETGDGKKKKGLLSHRISLWLNNYRHILRIHDRFVKAVNDLNTMENSSDAENTVEVFWI